jgi:hypothetical protein
MGLDGNPFGAQMPASVAMAELTIVDRDLQNVRITLGPGLPLEGEVALEGPVPEKPIATKVILNLVALSRSPLNAERTGVRADIPGTFSFPSLLMSDYGVRALINAVGMYVKDVTYAGVSILDEPLRLGSAMQGAGLRVVVGRDGATLNARVTDKDGNPLGSTVVLVMPANVRSEAVLQAHLVIGESDQAGLFVSHTLPPGKYFVAALTEPVDATTASIDRLWRWRLKFKEVELAPSGSAQVTLEPLKIQ